MKKLVVPVVLFAALFYLVAENRTENAAAGAARVLDGDTLVVIGKRIRLAGIDAPEKNQTCSVDGRTWECGRRALVALSRLIDGRRVICAPLRPGEGRLFHAVCRVKDLDLGAAMVESGWAVALDDQGAGYAGLHRRAKAGKLGIWGGEFELPWVWRENRK